MLILAFALLCGAALFGAALAICYLAQTCRAQPAVVPAAHGLAGAAGLAVLLLALHRGLPHTSLGTGGFGPIAAVLLALALAVGLATAPAAWRRRRPSGALVAAHAGLAIVGLVMLLTLVALR